MKKVTLKQVQSAKEPNPGKEAYLQNALKKMHRMIVLWIAMFGLGGGAAVLAGVKGWHSVKLRSLPQSCR